MNKNTIQLWLWVILAVIIVAIIGLVILEKKQIVKPVSTQDINNQDTGVSVIPISYNNALVKYADRRIQLDKTCQAHPNNVTYKDNTGIMIDNRSAQTRTVKVGTTFTIKPWGFKIVILPDVYLKSKSILLDCDKYQNVATILVQE